MPPGSRAPYTAPSRVPSLPMRKVAGKPGEGKAAATDPVEVGSQQVGDPEFGGGGSSLLGVVLDGHPQEEHLGMAAGGFVEVGHLLQAQRGRRPQVQHDRAAIAAEVLGEVEGGPVEEGDPQLGGEHPFARGRPMKMMGRRSAGRGRSVTGEAPPQAAASSTSGGRRGARGARSEQRWGPGSGAWLGNLRALRGDGGAFPLSLPGPCR